MPEEDVLPTDDAALRADDALRTDVEEDERRPSIRPVAVRALDADDATRLELPERRTPEEATMLLPVARRFTLPATALA